MYECVILEKKKKLVCTSLHMQQGWKKKRTATTITSKDWLSLDEKPFSL